jgi:hypothetical protein
VIVLPGVSGREYAYAPAQVQSVTQVGAFTRALYGQPQKLGWTAISMKNDWKRFLRSNRRER